MAKVRIGISGWRYEPWRGTFYPKGLTQDRELEYASSKLASIEINGTFYSLQKPEYFRRWHDATPADFMFAVKGPRYVTHIRRLRDVEKPLANFFASGVLCLKDKFGPMLWQFPPNFKFDPQAFESFLKLLPHDTNAAAKLARGHEPRVKNPWTKADKRRPVRHAVEIRHESFRDEKFVAMLRKHNVAAVIADTANRFLRIEDVTADFLYLRMHGEEELYAGGYTPRALTKWAERIKAWQGGGEPKDAHRVAGEWKFAKKKPRDVFVYFDNSVKVKSPRDAMLLAKKLGVAK